MTIAVDFDGTIVEDRYPAIGKPVPYAFETLISLQKEGCRIILWTVREGRLLDEAVEFCRSKGLEFDAVNAEVGERKDSASPRKVRADWYVDDRGINGVPDWATVRGILSEGKAPSRHTRRSGDRHKKNIFKRISDRCRKSREKFG